MEARTGREVTVLLRYFCGLSLAETAEVLNVSPITIKRDWAAARAWLKSATAPRSCRCEKCMAPLNGIR